jgi:predicted DCC family thiol-disulfide oxidoreductase YuxK
MRQIIFFDGVCIFCNSFAKFIVKRDKKSIFQLCHLQSQIADDFALEYNFLREKETLNSLIFLKGNHVFKKSDAAIEIVSNLGFPYFLIRIFKIIPQKIRDYFYDYFAKNRYKWFGKKDSCNIPDEKIRSRILKK